MPKVSILMPACNVEKFLRECMDSVVNQTLEDIEIICIDDGSKDATGDILDEYAEKDSRIKVIHKPNSGYGHSMNVGIDNATGEYIGIVETDDFADLNMFEELYAVAKRCNADVVKSNYYTYVSHPEPQSTYFEVLKEYDLYDKVFKPVEHQDIFRVRPCIWSGIYRREMLLEKKVRFAETPGASYQDTGFAFKIWASAERAVLVKNAYLHYRTDNTNSSVKAAAKIYCLCDEFASIDAFILDNPEVKEKVEKLVVSLKYESYRWNLFRLALEYKYAFLLTMHKELVEAREKGLFDKSYFTDRAWENANRIVDDMDGYFDDTCRGELKKYGSVEELSVAANKYWKKSKKLQKKIDDMEASTSLKVGRAITCIPRKIKKALRK
ncbi:glycosyltransferase family 2 protein [Blautia sp. 2744]|uniref:Glycosyltransferase family 2 protein n=1 Tax=Blautia intestinalis TaxID=2763028 RepID=A0ABR7I162_9FIRM|nr:glycosyltransferase family 2 protein [Blautia intestinalis]MBC5740221.1 glycosyltransferase family 2 protein [Blautia intestinalis]RHD33059.1 glycosyltransferase family 2 protein [Blautia obeum]